MLTLNTRTCRRIRNYTASRKNVHQSVQKKEPSYYYMLLKIVNAFGTPVVKDSVIIISKRSQCLKCLPLDEQKGNAHW